MTCSSSFKFLIKKLQVSACPCGTVSTNDLLKSNDSNVRIQIDANAQKQLEEDGYEPTMGAIPLPPRPLQLKLFGEIVR